MADINQFNLIKEGVGVWNEWRNEHLDANIDLSESDLSGVNLENANLHKVNFSKTNLHKAIFFKTNLRNANLSGADLHGSDLYLADIQGVICIETNLCGARLMGADLKDANLSGANLSGADLTKADLYRATLYKANLSNSILSGADLSEANLYRADLRDVNLTGASIRKAILVEAQLEGAILTNSFVYGLSAWGCEGAPKDQSNLIITPLDEAEITVDDLEVAQFIYLLLNNQKVRNVIDTITSKTVLILGRFTEERKAILYAIKGELRKLNLTPILFDFDKPVSKDLTGTIETLARMARFIIADITDPSSIPHELATIVPFLRTTPIMPIRKRGAEGYTMFEDYQRAYPWVLSTYEYDDVNIFGKLANAIDPANKMAEVFRSK